MSQVEITAQQREFCLLIAHGMSAADAYGKAFQKPWKRESLVTAAWKEKKKPQVRAFLEKSYREVEKPLRLSRDKRLEALAEIITEKPEGKPKHSDRIAAVKEYNVMLGDNAPTRVAVDISANGLVDSILSTLAVPGQPGIIEIPERKLTAIERATLGLPEAPADAQAEEEPDTLPNLLGAGELAAGEETTP